MKKYLLIARTNGKSNLIHYLLLILIYVLSTISIILSIDFKDNTIEAVYNTLEAQNAHIHMNIHTDDENKRYFDATEIEKTLQNEQDIDWYIKNYTRRINYNNSSKMIFGTQIDKLQEINVSILKESSNTYENGVYISSNLSSLYKLNLDDTIKISDNDISYELKVKAITDNSLIYVQNGDPLVVDINYLQKLYNAGNVANMIILRAKSVDKIDSLYNKLSKLFENEHVIIIKGFNPDSFTFYIEPISIGIIIFSIFAILSSIILCYSIYKYLISCRVKRIAIYKSLGVSKKELYISAFIESLILSIFSWGLGVYFGSGAIAGAGAIATGMAASLKVSPLSLILSFVFVLGCSWLSTLITHKKIFKSSVVSLLKGQEIEENKDEKTAKINNIVKYVSIGLIFTISLVFTIVFALQDSMPSLIIAFSSGVILVFVSIYIIIQAILSIMNKVFKYRNVSFKSFKDDTRKSKSILFVLSLIIGLTSLSTTISSTLNDTLATYYSDIDALALVSDHERMDTILKEKDYGIKNYYRAFNSTQKYEDIALNIFGVDSKDYKYYSQDSFVYDTYDNIFAKVDSVDNGVIISSTFSKQHDINLDDNITLKTINGTNEFKVCGIVNSFENGGGNIVCNQQIYNKYFSSENVYYYIVFNDGVEVNQTLLKMYEDNRKTLTISVYDMTSLVARNNREIRMIFLAVYFLVIILVAISTLNVIISMSIIIKNKSHEFSILYTLGQSKKQILIKNIIFYSSIILFTGLVTILSMGGLNYIIFNILNLNVGYFTYNYTFSYIGLIATFVVLIFSLIPLIIRFRKINMLEEVRGE